MPQAKSMTFLGPLAGFFRSKATKPPSSTGPEELDGARSGVSRDHQRGDQDRHYQPTFQGTLPRLPCGQT